MFGEALHMLAGMLVSDCSTKPRTLVVRRSYARNAGAAEGLLKDVRRERLVDSHHLDFKKVRGLAFFFTP